MSTGSRAAWNDRFRKPSAEILTSEVARGVAPAVSLYREQLLATAGVTEEISWQGVPWRWSLLYRHEAVQGRAWAYLVAQPGQPLAIVPLTSEGIAALPMRRLLKPVRDAITHAKQVEGVWWAQWTIQSKSQVESLVKIARIQLEQSSVASGMAAGAA
ncbi:MAG: hypothetical protein U0573_06770 [Phycisphaerales bacterium]|nr:hypothetical protein [Planctomycetota bacterium]